MGGELDADAEKTEEATERLAVCNMDWDRVGAEDLFLLLSSFCPPSGTVSWVKIYVSDFGKERLEEEKTLGPKELRRLKGEEEGDDTDDDEDDLDHIDYNKKALKRQAAAMEKVRQYQVNRLKYYYAVVQFDAVQTASKVYDECDGMEYELSATRLDLRFIPGDMDFSDSPVSSCLHPPDPEKYQPKLFCTTALQQGKVELTWDEEDQDKMKAMKDAYSKVDNDDYGNMSHLIGSASESENDDDDDNIDKSDEDGESEKDAISKYKALLADISEKESKEDQGNMEVTWNDEDVTEEAQEELTPWEKYLKKKKEKKKKKKSDNVVDDDVDDIPDGVDINDPFFAEELGEDYVKSKKLKKNKKHKPTKTDSNDNPEDQKDLALMVMDSDDEKDHFDFKHIVEAESKNGKSKKKKWKKKKKELEIPADDNFSVDVADNRFSAMFNKPDFNIDPTNPNFKKTKNMEKILGEKQKRISSNLNVEEKYLVSSKKQKIDPEVSQALKSVKNKWNKNKMKNSKSKLKFTVK